MPDEIKDRLPIAWEGGNAYTIEDRYSGGVEHEYDPPVIFDTNGDVIASPNEDLSNMKEWCDFVVKACNSHYELLAACEAMLRVCEKAVQLRVEGFLKCTELGRAAVAKAKGSAS